MSRLGQIWRHYWFRPAPLLDLAVCRILIVGFEMHRLVFYPPLHAINELAKLSDDMYRPLKILHLFNLLLGAGYRPSADLLEFVYWITVAAGFLALIGWKTNPSLVIFAAGNVYIQSFQYSFREYHHVEAILLIALSALALSPAGGVLSLDDLIRRRRESIRNRRFDEVRLTRETSVFSRWPLLLVQWLFAFIYMSAAYSKLSNGGLAWINGYTLQYYLAQDGLRRNIPLGQWASQFHLFAQFGTTVVLLYQLTFFLVPLFPVLAIFYLPLGLTFHSLVYVLLRAPFFTWMWLYVVFVPWTGLIRFVRGPESGISGRELKVLYDGECPLCLRSMTLISYFDWFGRILYVDVTREWPRLAESLPGRTKEDCLREMVVLHPDGSVTSGFYAFRDIAWKIPPFWPFVMFFYLPMASSLGPKIYRFIASRRLRFERCESGTCLHHQGT